MSEFWKRKVRTFFTLFDYNKDGVMTKDEWMDLARRFIKSSEPDQKKAETLLTAFDKAWAQRLKYVDNKERVTIDQFVDSIGKQRFDPDLIRYEEDLIRAFYSLMHLKSEGYLTEDEYQTIFVQFGVADTPWTKETFQGIDTNGDGKLSINEFIAGFIEFFYSEDKNSPNRFFFGPLVDQISSPETRQFDLHASA